MGITIGGIGSWIGGFFTTDAAAAGAGAGTAAAAGGAATGTAATAAGTGAVAAGTAEAAIPEVVVTAGPAATAAAGGGGGGLVAAGAGAAGGVAAGSSLGGGPYQVPDSGPAPPGHPILKTLGEAAAIAQGASSLYSLATMQRGVSIPPTPGAVQQDQSIANAEQAELARREAAGGLQSTIGTPGGAQGAFLSPSTTSNRSILGG
jgi:hypothetical protein